MVRVKLREGKYADQFRVRVKLRGGKYADHLRERHSDPPPSAIDINRYQIGKAQSCRVGIATEP